MNFLFFYQEFGFFNRSTHTIFIPILNGRQAPFDYLASKAKPESTEMPIAHYPKLLEQS